MDAKLDFLLTEKQYCESKLAMTQKAIECIDFLVLYFKLIDGKDVDIKVEEKTVKEVEPQPVIETEIELTPDPKPEPEQELPKIEEPKPTEQPPIESLVTPKRNPDVEKKRDAIIALISKRQKAFTSKEMEVEYRKSVDGGNESEVFARNTIYNFYNSGKLKRTGTTPYQYGMRDWFNMNGTLKTEFK